MVSPGNRRKVVAGFYDVVIKGKLGTFRGHQGLAEVGVYLGQIECRRGSELAEFIIHELTELLRSRLHQLALLAQIDLKGFYQPHGHEGVISQLGQYQGSLRSKITSAWGSAATR